MQASRVGAPQAEVRVTIWGNERKLPKLRSIIQSITRTPCRFEHLLHDYGRCYYNPMALVIAIV